MSQTWFDDSCEYELALSVSAINVLASMEMKCFLAYEAAAALVALVLPW